MKLIIDDADVNKIKTLYEYYPVDGVTTNPSILAKSGRNPYDVLSEIRGIIGDDACLHAQVISRKAEDMVEEGKYMVSRLGTNTYIKIPVTREGVKAIKLLKAEGYHVTATAIYNVQQAFLAAKAGADYAAPYVNRIDNLGENGIEYALRIHNMFVRNNFSTSLLAASFKNTRQLLTLAEAGVGAATVSADVIEALLGTDRNVDHAIDAFIADFEGLCGEGKTMLNC